MSENTLALALEAAMELNKAHQELSAVTLEVTNGQKPDFLARLTGVMNRSTARADEDIKELRALHAELLGIPVEKLDERMAEEKAKEKADRETAKGHAQARRAIVENHAHEAGPPSVKKEKGKVAEAPKSKLTTRQRELLRDFDVTGNVARFKREEHIPDWAAVKEVFLTLGAKWKTGKPGGFHFPEEIDGKEKVRLALESGEILDLKGAGFFPTPTELADRIVKLAEIQPGEFVLEPSAGKGAIAEAVKRACDSAMLMCVELIPDNAAELKRKGFRVVGSDFLTLERDSIPTPDVIVANPPFALQADIKHVDRMMDFLEPGGRLVSIMSAGVAYRDDTKTRDFRAWVKAMNGALGRLPDGSFKESGTMVGTCLLHVVKS